MKTIYNILLSFIALFILQSNDSVINGSGTDIFPISETRVSIKKEILTLTLKDNRMFVDVYYEFYNPDERKELILGFVVPPSYDREPEDSTNIEDRVPIINQFTVLVNNKQAPYELDLLKDTPFDSLKQIEGEWHYAYHFKANFKSGLNIVKHTYNFEGGFDSGGGEFYSYILKTAKNWANSEIEDFTLNLDLGTQKVFWIYNISQKNNWKIIGSGKNEVGYTGAQNFILKEGYVTYHEKNFSPLRDIDIYIPSIIENYNKEDIIYQACNARREALETLDKKRLGLARNFFFAKNGYDFKNNEIKDFYSSYFWYIPNNKLTSDAIYETLTSEEKRRIDLIRDVEKSKE